MHSWLVLAVLCSALVGQCWGDGAGRAFPVDSENYVIQQFKKISPELEWDKTNFLVDLSGQFATCKQGKGQVRADRKTPNGVAVDVFVDLVRGNESDIDAVDKYIREVIDRWVKERQYNDLIYKAKRFGCSVRPKCSGNAVIACVVTEDDGSKASSITNPEENGGGGHGGDGNNGGGDGNNGGGHGNNGGGHGDNGGGWGDGNNGGGWDGSRNKTEKDESENGNGLDGYNQKALAFTKEQYDIAENILGNKWDRSHFLEDLSGFETDCTMIGRRDWAFDKIKKPARDRNLKITGQYGNAPNKGSTPDALKDILSKFKPIQAKQMGCSIIPDCKSAGGMEVVISCLYEDA